MWGETKQLRSPRRFLIIEDTLEIQTQNNQNLISSQSFCCVNALPLHPVDLRRWFSNVHCVFECGLEMDGKAVTIQYGK